MAYLVLARKYRPQTFDAVVGQEHVTRTLKNAIRGHRVAHAILFSGPRGTGKTTIARILAKAMNCEAGPSETPCNACRSCTDITSGRGVDVFEIDGASNNSVEQVRELRDNSRYMPAHSRFKIYIIDEVHMLSIAAFNALLKTLEEPPAHVMFLFATTEAHKIPITILSRCQRHDLRRIDLAAISAHLEHLCREEAVSVSPATLWHIARESGGSMRDALSLLDQVLACSDDRVDDAYVMHLLGGTDRQVLFDLSAAIFSGDITTALTVIDGVYKRGQDLKRFYADLLDHFRHLMLVKMAADPDLLNDLPPGESDILAEQVGGLSTAAIDQVLSLLFDADAAVRHAVQPRLAIEMVLFKIQQIKPALPIDLLIEHLDRLLNDPAAAVRSGPDGGSRPQAPSPPAGPPSRTPAPTGTPRSDMPPPADSPADAPAVGSGPAKGRDDASLWRQVVDAIVAKQPSLGGALSRAQLAEVTENAFTVEVGGNEYAMRRLDKHQATIEAICRQLCGRTVTFRAGGDDERNRRTADSKQKEDGIRQQLLNHPLVADAVDIFSGKIEEIKLR